MVVLVAKFDFVFRQSNLDVAVGFSGEEVAFSQDVDPAFFRGHTIVSSPFYFKTVEFNVLNQLHSNLPHHTKEGVSCFMIVLFADEELHIVEAFKLSTLKHIQRCVLELFEVDFVTGFYLLNKGLQYHI